MGVYGRMNDAKESLPPFDMGVREFKKAIRANPNLSKGDKNKAIKVYKDRVYERVDLIKERYEEIRDGRNEEQEANLSVGREQTVLRQSTEQESPDKSTDKEV